MLRLAGAVAGSAVLGTAACSEEDPHSSIAASNSGSSARMQTATGMQTATRVQPVGSPSGGPWVLAFDDDFTTGYALPYGNGPNPAVWADHFIWGDAGGRVNNLNELQWYPHGYYGCSVSGSILSLTAIYQNPQSVDPLCPNPLQRGGKTGTFTSGMVQSHPGFRFTYGYAEAYIAQPGSSGILPPGAWPAFWMTTADDVWPPEFDILENGGGGGERSAYWDYSSLVSSSTIPGGSPDYTQYHYYGLRWTPSDVTFFFDGTQIGTYATSAKICSNACSVILNLAVEGVSSGAGYPASLNIDYVRVWTIQGVPAQPAITSISPATGYASAGDVTVSFSSVSGASSYRVTACPVDWVRDSGRETGPTTRHTATGTSSPITVTGLLPGIQYDSTVSAVNGSGLYSVESLPVPVLARSPLVPGTPASPR